VIYASIKGEFFNTISPNHRMLPQDLMAAFVRACINHLRKKRVDPKPLFH
jgi:hypothetical protein